MPDNFRPALLSGYPARKTNTPLPLPPFSKSPNKPEKIKKATHTPDNAFVIFLLAIHPEPMHGIASLLILPTF
jgi:hypothetical protein